MTDIYIRYSVTVVNKGPGCSKRPGVKNPLLSSAPAEIQQEFSLRNWSRFDKIRLENLGDDVTVRFLLLPQLFRSIFSVAILAPPSS